MNFINRIGNNPNFGGLYVDKDGMGQMASALSESLARQLEYSDTVDKLDKMGVDVVIIKDSKNPDDRAKVAFVDSKDRLFKIGDNDLVKTIKTYKLPERRAEYDDNIDTVLNVADNIAQGNITKRTTRMTQTLYDVLQSFPVRSNSLKGQEPFEEHGIDIEV